MHDKDFEERLGILDKYRKLRLQKTQTIKSQTVVLPPMIIQKFDVIKQRLGILPLEDWLLCEEPCYCLEGTHA